MGMRPIEDMMTNPAPEPTTDADGLPCRFAVRRQRSAKGIPCCANNPVYLLRAAYADAILDAVWRPCETT